MKSLSFPGQTLGLTTLDKGKPTLGSDLTIIACNQITSESNQGVYWDAGQENSSDSHRYFISMVILHTLFIWFSLPILRSIWHGIQMVTSCPYSFSDPFYRASHGWRHVMWLESAKGNHAISTEISWELSAVWIWGASTLPSFVLSFWSDTWFNSFPLVCQVIL